MPYDPIRDAPNFRETLRQLARTERLTSQTIVDLFNRQRTRGDNLAISRATLDRFTRGEHITKIRELRAIHDMLRATPAYAAYFAPTPFEPDTPSQGFGQALGAMFAAGTDTGAKRRMDDMRAAMPGKYTFMRRDHDRVSLENGVRVSSFWIEEAEGGLTARESQSHRTPDGDMPFEQIDHGYLFVHGPSIYFLTKEIGGTAVKFGAIEMTLPETDRRQPVQYFQGYLLVSSRRGIFPRALRRGG